MNSWRVSSCLALCLTNTSGVVFAQGLGGGRTSGLIGGDPSSNGVSAQPLFVTGQVVMFNGEAPPERVAIERFCSISDTRKEGYTDAAGRFNLQLGLDQAIVAEPRASDSGGGQGNPLLQGRSTPHLFWNCELRASLSGYISTTVTLAGHHSSDSPDVGYIVLRPFQKTDGLSVSATTALAPEASRRAFEKGMDALKNKDLKDAEKAFKKAVEVFDRHTEAWYQLGRVYQQRKQPDPAREAFLKATKTDPNYVFPYEGLYQLAFERGDMADLLDNTELLLRLNPYEFPTAYYFSAVANLQLQNFDAGEERIRAAIQMDPGHKNPMSFYVLGHIMAAKGHLAEAVDSFENFLELRPDDGPAQRARAAVEKLQGILAGQNPQRGGGAAGELNP